MTMEDLVAELEERRDTLLIELEIVNLKLDHEVARMMDETWMAEQITIYRESPHVRTTVLNFLMERCTSAVYHEREQQKKEKADADVPRKTGKRKYTKHKPAKAAAQPAEGLRVLHIREYVNAKGQTVPAHDRTVRYAGGKLVPVAAVGSGASDAVATG